MSFKLYGPTYSTNTRRVAVIAKERNIPYEQIHVDLAKAEQKQPDHVKHQPFGEVPYVVVRRLSHPFIL
jgi:glutathione S-transferase